MAIQFIPLDVSRAKLRIGVLTISRAAQMHCLSNDTHPSNLVNEHQYGQPGDASTPDEEAEFFAALNGGGTLISRWTIANSTVVVTTSSDRKTTHMKMLGE